MELEFVGHEANGKVALSDPVPAGFEGGLVAGQPALVAHYCMAMDGCAIDVVVHVAAQVDELPLVPRLDLATFLAAGNESRGQRRED